MKSSTLKIFFNAASEGRVDRLKDLLGKNPILVNTHNKNTDHSAIFYSVKNLKKEATLYLLTPFGDISKYKSKITNRELDRLITYEWYGSLSSFYFLLSIGSDLTFESTGLSQDEFKKWIRDKYISSYYQNRNIERLINFLDSIGEEVNWSQHLDMYLKQYRDSTNLKHLPFIRELKLRTIL